MSSKPAPRWTTRSPAKRRGRYPRRRLLSIAEYRELHPGAEPIFHALLLLGSNSGASGTDASGLTGLVELGYLPVA